MAISVLSLLLLVILKKLILWKTNSAKHCKFNGLCFVSKARFSPTAIWLIILWRCAARMFIRNSIALESPALWRNLGESRRKYFSLPPNLGGNFCSSQSTPTTSRREKFFLPSAHYVKEGKVFPPKAHHQRQGGKSFSSQAPTTSRREKFFLPKLKMKSRRKYIFLPPASFNIFRTLQRVNYYRLSNNGENQYFEQGFCLSWRRNSWLTFCSRRMTFQRRKSVFWTEILSFFNCLSFTS